MGQHRRNYRLQDDSYTAAIESQRATRAIIHFLFIAYYIVYANDIRLESLHFFLVRSIHLIIH